MLSSHVNAKNVRGNKYIDEDVVYKRKTRKVYGVARGLLLLLQALLYVAASAMYFHNVIHRSYAKELGAILFIVGAFFKLIAEILRLYRDRVGLFCYGKYRQAYIAERIEAFTYPEYAHIEKFIRVEVGLGNLFLVIAAVLDLARSVLYLPEVHTLTSGISLHIAASVALLIADMWLIYQLGRMQEGDPYNLTFRIRNACSNPAQILFRLFSALAAIFYLIGSVLFLPDNNKTDSDQDRVGGLNEAGAFAFLVSSLLACLGVCIGGDV
ncbi:unnamed protein product [Adineta steineri]|uniref:Uncharacterized protein n=1 Tax=Adineta steineri TaxID=433720 RepID=A0A815BQD6_9BILA|nr:unnamed protein product [Adineta steineri]CAF4135948.1 unnamed protein product [Adineta steineri]